MFSPMETIISNRVNKFLYSWLCRNMEQCVPKMLRGKSLGNRICSMTLTVRENIDLFREKDDKCAKCG